MLWSSYSALSPQGDAPKTLWEQMELTHHEALDLSPPFIPYVTMLAACNLPLTLS